MKIYLILIVLIAVLASCNSTTKDETVTKAESESPVIKNSVSTVIGEISGKVVPLTTETFKQKVFNFEVNQEWKYEGTVPAIVDFYADWCGPCKRVAPVLDELAKEYEGRIIIYKVDTEKHRELSTAFGIRSIPTILFVPVEGQPQAAQGALPKESFVQAINEVLLLEKKDS